MKEIKEQREAKLLLSERREQSTHSNPSLLLIFRSLGVYNIVSSRCSSRLQWQRVVLKILFSRQLKGVFIGYSSVVRRDSSMIGVRL